MTMQRNVEDKVISFYQNGRMIKMVWPITDAQGEEIIPLMRIGVLLMKDGVPLLGHVVTHLDIDDWAALHHVKVIRAYPKRHAYINERTDLF